MKTLRSRLILLTLVGALGACTITPARVVTHPVHMHPPAVVIADPYPPPRVVIAPAPPPHIVVTPHYHQPRPVIIKRLPPGHHRHDRRHWRD